MEINLEPTRITKELILSKVSEEQLMEHYLGIPVKKGLYKSPLRNDNTPTCSFYRNKNGELIFKDFAGYFCGNFISVVIEKFQCSFIEALKIIANDFGIIHSKNLVVNKPALEFTGTKFEEQQKATIQVEIQEFSQYELSWWKSYGITKDTLNKFNVYSCKNIWLNNNLFHLADSSHIYGYFGGVKDGIETWKLYWPGRKKYRFISNWTATQIQGAKQLDRNGGKYLVITKSLKDCMCLYEFGIPAIAPNSENLFLTRAQYDRLKTKFKFILLVYDNDLPGINGLRKIHKEYPDLRIAFIPRKFNAKDISDFYKMYGKDKTQELINKTKEYYFGKEENRSIL